MKKFIGISLAILVSLAGIYTSWSANSPLTWIEEQLANLNVTQSFTLSGTLTPTSLSGDVNDYAPTNLATAQTLRLDGGASSRNITGLSAGANGRILTLSNIGTNTLVLKDASASSSVANRFILSNDVTVAGDSSVTLRYDVTGSGGWRLFSSAGSVACTDNATGECTLSATRSSSDPDFVASKVLAGNNILGVIGTAIGNGDITTSLQCHYKFDDGSGTTAVDSSGNGFTMALTGTPAWAPNNGQINGALLMDGVDDYGYASGCAPPTGDFTYAMWVSVTNRSAVQTLFAGMVSSASSTNELELGFNANDTTLRLNDNQLTFNASNIIIPPSGWHLVMLIRSERRVSFYVDTQILTSTEVSATLSFGTCGLIIGMDPDGTGCAGVPSAWMTAYVDDARIYTRALSAEDRVLLYSTYKTQTDHSASVDLTTNLDTHLSFNESSGTIAEDSTANNHDGTLTGGAVFITSGCHLSNCVELDGTNDYVEIVSPAAPTGDFTYAFWAFHDLQATSEYWITIMDTTTGTSNEIGFQRNATNPLRILIDSGANIILDAFAAYSDTGVWTHFAFTRKGGFFTIFISGIPIHAGYTIAILGFGTCPILLGADSDSTGCNATLNEFMNGRLDEFYQFSRALTTAEIAALAAL